MQKITADLIAACGMNCAICMAYLRQKNKCMGCNGPDMNKPKHCIVCSIKNCEELANSETKLCYTCKKYPCRRLKQLDKRYREKYAMSMIENLNNIRLEGMNAFLITENTRWRCPQCGENICVHNKKCYTCEA
jgi:hypothetical protein